MEVIFGDMSNTIDTLLALSVTLEAVTAGKHELNESGYNVSDAWSQLAEGKVTLIEYLENEYHLGHYKSPLIKRLELALMAAEDKINAAFKDANGDVYHDWKAVAGLCQEWISTINGYYRYNPEPGTMAHAFLKMMKEPPSCDKLRKPTHTASGNNQFPTEMEETFASQELQEVKQQLIKAGLIDDGRWTGAPAEFECLVKTFKDVFGIKTKKGDLARKACAVFVGFTGNLESARSSTHNEQQSPNANIIKAICKEIHTKYVK